MPLYKTVQYLFIDYFNISSGAIKYLSLGLMLESMSIKKKENKEKKTDILHFVFRELAVNLEGKAMSYRVLSSLKCTLKVKNKVWLESAAIMRKIAMNAQE